MLLSFLPNLKKGEHKMTPTNSENQITERIDQLEARITQLETVLKYTVTFENLAARLVGNPVTIKVRKPRSKRVLTPEEKAAFHARMVAAKLAKEKSRNASKK
jgi:hypothetical protein